MTLHTLTPSHKEACLSLLPKTGIDLNESQAINLGQSISLAVSDLKSHPKDNFK